MQDVLEQVRDPNMRVFVVWEPVILTDLAPPTSGVLSRLHDPRAMQYWDHERLLSGEIVRSALTDTTRFHDDDLGEDTIVWDVVAIYPPGARWDTSFPLPTYQGNPVVDVTDEVLRHLTARSR